jgi:hypothetical protein
MSSQKHIVTQEDLDNNPDLVNAGVQVGEEIDIPQPDTDLAKNDDAPEDGPGPRPKDRNNP